MKKTTKILSVLMVLVMAAALMSTMAFAAPEHNWDAENPEAVWADDYSSCTVRLNCLDEGCEAKAEKFYTAKNHEIKSEVVPPTCTEDGYTRHTIVDPNTYWSNGLYVDSDVVPATGHNTTITETVDIANKKYTVVTSCNDCDYSFTEVYDIVETVQQPTCTEDGFKKYAAVVGDTNVELTDYTEVIPALGHDVGEGKFAPTGDVWFHYQHCKRCDKNVNPQPHEWGEWKVTKEPTDHERGEAIQFCKVCGGNQTCEIPARTPQTGDDSMLGLWVGLLILSGGAAVSLAVRKRKEH